MPFSLFPEKASLLPPGPEGSRPRLSLPADAYGEIYAIGDVHGCLDLLLAAEEHIFRAAAATPGPKLIVMLGDYIDRGPNSAGVIDHLLAPPPDGFDRVCLCGNHEDMLESFLVSPRFEPHWLVYGGDATLASYGIDSDEAFHSDATGARLKKLILETVPVAHLDFVTRTPVCLEVGSLLFVHAGIQPGLPLDRQIDQDLMWIREPFLSFGPGLDLTVIHGHTPVAEPDFGPGRIGIDTGAFMTGRLTALRLADGAASIVE